MNKAKDLRDQKLEELEATYQESCRKLFEVNNQFKSEKRREKPHEAKHLRKDIARLLTVINEKRRQEQPSFT